MARKTLRTSYISTVISIALVLFMIGTLGVLVLHANRLSNYLKENIQLNVTLLPDAGDQDIEKLRQTLKSSPAILDFEYVTKDSAAAQLTRELGEDFVSFLGYNPLLATFDIRLNADYAQTDSINRLKSIISSSPAVKEIHYQESLIHSINKNVRTLALIILGFSALLLFIAAALINNTIRISLYSKRMLIKSMKLVGATRGFIRKPFMISGIKQGVYGAVIANLLLAGILYLARVKIPELGAIQDINMLLVLMGGVTLMGIFISAVSTLLAVNKYLRKNSEDLY
ncbi:MAG TPA: permease-like cell division protein FtsX [Bacteroidia bacterium]|nr:permease-like cell division protein FtsX [Bacteroidia bacterium]